MMMKIQVTGFLGKDMELKTYKDNSEYIESTLSHNIRKKDLSGAWVTVDTIWFNLYIKKPNLLRNFKNNLLKKSKKVDVSGRFTIGKKRIDDSPLYSISISDHDDEMIVG